MKKNRLRTMFILLILVAASVSVRAQQGFGTNSPESSTVVDIKSGNKGVLLPRVALQSTTDVITVPNPADHLVVFNTATVATTTTPPVSGVSPGLYYWNSAASVWVQMINSSGAVGVNTTNPQLCAALDVSSTSQGVLPPRMTSEQIAAISNPTPGLLVYNTTKGCLAYYAKNFFNCTDTPPCGTDITVTHLASNGVAPVNKTVTYKTLEYKGKCWITKNLGADQQASSFSDNTSIDTKVGWYWQFNRKQGFSKSSASRTPNLAWSTYNNYPSGAISWDLTNDPCRLLLGSTWRIPTSAEWLSTIAGWATVTDIYGALKLHAAGLLNAGDGKFGEQTSRGLYWSSTNAGATSASYLNLLSTGTVAYINGALYAYGFPLRCLRD